MKKGFTLIEVLLVIAIIGILASVILVSFGASVRKKGRDVQRISFLKQLDSGLELYYAHYGHYPPAGGSDSYGFIYKNRSGGSCSAFNASLRFDNSTSSGFLVSMFKLKMLPIESWNDPLNPPQGDHGNRYNCRYIIPSSDCKSTKKHIETNCMPPGSTYNANSCTCKPQKYFVHCTLEGDKVLNDEGLNPHAFEISSDPPWLCLKNIPV